jgi:hypothetical protein
MRLHYTLANDLTKLHDELIAAIPSLAPVPMDDPPFPGALRPVMTVEGSGDNVWLTVPDDTDVAAVDAVIAAHDPTPPAPAPTQAEQVDQIVAAGKEALAAAPIETDEGRALAAIFAGALDGLGATFGTSQGDQP